MRVGMVLALAALVLAVSADYVRPAAVHPRRFDAHQVAHSETGMWLAYYEHRRMQLFCRLVGMLHSQYGLSYTRAIAAGWYAAHAAVVFQRGASRADYEKALPGLQRYYVLMRRGSDVPFDPHTAARAELEWWIAHRERRADLPRTLAVLQSSIYGLAPDRFEAHAAARARAMLWRDEKGSTITDRDWQLIEHWLDESWGSLHAAVQ